MNRNTKLTIHELSLVKSDATKDREEDLADQVGWDALENEKEWMKGCECGCGEGWEDYDTAFYGSVGSPSRQSKILIGHGMVRVV